MILSDVTNSLALQTAVAPTTNDLSFNVTFTDSDPDLEDPRVSNVGTFNEVTTNFVDVPTYNDINESAYVREVKEVSIFNKDTASHTIIVTMESTSGVLAAPLYKFILGVDERAQYTVPEGWQIYDANGVKKNDVSGGTVKKTTRIDEASATITYIGKADPGTLEADPLWMIQRIDTTTPGVMIILYADGNSDEDNIWDDRAVLIYS